MIPQEVRDRIKKAQDRWPQIVQPYIEWHPLYSREMDRVLCKVCRRTIRHFVEDDRFTESKTIDGQVVMYKKLIFAVLPNYLEIKITCDDGSNHITGLCNDCSNLLTFDTLEAVYCADLEQWRVDEESGRGTIPWDVYGKRIPLSSEKA